MVFVREHYWHFLLTVRMHVWGHPLLELGSVHVRYRAIRERSNEFSDATVSMSPNASVMQNSRRMVIGIHSRSKGPG